MINSNVFITYNLASAISVLPISFIALLTNSVHNISIKLEKNNPVHISKKQDLFNIPKMA